MRLPFVRPMTRYRAFLSAVLVFLAVTCFAVDFPQKAPTDGVILPKEFAGWRLQGTFQNSQDPAAADTTNPVVLKEYGFTDFSSGTYTREDGRKLTVRAARFADASGAYGAFTYYKQPEMLNE